MRNVEFNWLISHPEETQKFAGEYIAIVGEAIVAHGQNFEAVLSEAEKKTGQEPFMYKVPASDRELVV